MPAAASLAFPPSVHACQAIQTADNEMHNHNANKVGEVKDLLQQLLIEHTIRANNAPLLAIHDKE
jgi:hypothetical protein